MRAFQIVIDRRPLRAVPQAFSALHGVVDVLVDGTNVTARIGQDHALPLLRDLAYASADLACGRQTRSTLRFYDQRDAWALALERVGEQVLITVFQGGATPKVAVHERPVQGEALVRGVLLAIDDVLTSPATPGALAADLTAARRMLGSAPWSSASRTEAESIAVEVEMRSEGTVAFGTELRLRAQPANASGAPEVERNDLHSLLLKGPFRFRVGDARRELGDAYPFLIAESLIREAAEVLEAWEAGRALNHRVEAGGVFITTRLTSDGNLALGIGGPRTLGARKASTFPAVPVPAFVEAVVAFSRGLARPMVRHDRAQHSNLRMRAFRESLRDLADALREAVREDAKYNESPESYRAFASSTTAPVQTLDAWGAGRLRFSPAWQATVPSIDLHATFMFGERIVVGGSREMACIDRGTGHVVWRTQVERGISIPAPSGVLRISGDGILSHYELETGELTLSTKLAARTGGMPAGAVVNAPGLPKLAVVSEGERHITAVDLVSGEVRWRHALGRGRSFKVRRAGRLLVVSSAETTLSALDVASGETVWRIRDRQRFCRPAAYDANALFVVTGDNAMVTRHNEVLLALDPWTGVPRWKQELPQGRRTIGAPLVAGDAVLVVTQDQRGVGFLAFDRENGAARWAIDPGFAPANSAWLLIDGLLVINGERGEVAAIDVRTGVPRWRQRHERALDADVPRHLDPVLRSGALFLPGQAVNVVRPHDGEVIGQVPTELVPDLVRVDDRCNVMVVEESGHIAAFTAGAKLTLIKS